MGRERGVETGVEGLSFETQKTQNETDKKRMRWKAHEDHRASIASVCVQLSSEAFNQQLTLYSEASNSWMVELVLCALNSTLGR